jgi:hypothetical protein
MAQRDRRPAQRRVLYPAPRQLFETDNRDTITCENLCRATYQPVVSNVVFRDMQVQCFGSEIVGTGTYDSSNRMASVISRIQRMRSISRTGG